MKDLVEFGGNYANFVLDIFIFNAFNIRHSGNIDGNLILYVIISGVVTYYLRRYVMFIERWNSAKEIHRDSLIARSFSAVFPAPFVILPVALLSCHAGLISSTCAVGVKQYINAILAFFVIQPFFISIGQNAPFFLLTRKLWSSNGRILLVALFGFIWTIVYHLYLIYILSVYTSISMVTSVSVVFIATVLGYAIEKIFAGVDWTQPIEQSSGTAKSNSTGQRTKTAKGGERRKGNDAGDSSPMLQPPAK